MLNIRKDRIRVEIVFNSRRRLFQLRMPLELMSAVFKSGIFLILLLHGDCNKTLNKNTYRDESTNINMIIKVNPIILKVNHLR